MNTKDILLRHFRKYPEMTPRDAVKLLYQSSFGGGHLITDPEGVRGYLIRERNESEKLPHECLAEDIGSGIFRLHLGALPEFFSDDTVFSIFCASAQAVKGDRDAFHEKIETLLSLADRVPFCAQELNTYLESYRAAGEPMVSHSDVYRDTYHPHYRVISRGWAQILPLLEAIEEQRSHGQPVRLLIDGPCATGKTTLAQKLAELYRCPVFHMDDYFLPEERKTAERLSEAGGNVDYERFREEISLPLMQGRDVLYTPYNCYTEQFRDPVSVPACGMAIIEGSYANHAYLRDAGTLRVKLTLSLSERLNRILRRNGQAMLERFKNEWIPLEDRYFEKMAKDGNFDLILPMDEETDGERA